MASLALYREARKVEDSMTLENGLLVLVKRQSRTLSPYGLTCRMNDRPMFLTFAGQEGNLGALLTERSGRCLSFGPKFDIGFDPDTVDLVADPKRGDLVVLGGALYVTATWADAPASDRYLVDLKRGTIQGVPERHVAVIRRWSICIESLDHLERCPVYANEPGETATGLP
jgi:hypothetical protein